MQAATVASLCTNNGVVRPQRIVHVGAPAKHHIVAARLGLLVGLITCNKVVVASGKLIATAATNGYVALATNQIKTGACSKDGVHRARGKVLSCPRTHNYIVNPAGYVACGQVPNRHIALGRGAGATCAKAHINVAVVAQIIVFACIFANKHRATARVGLNVPACLNAKHLTAGNIKPYNVFIGTFLYLYLGVGIRIYQHSTQRIQIHHFAAAAFNANGKVGTAKAASRNVLVVRTRQLIGPA